MQLAIALINRTLEHEGWAREKLAAHAGRTVRFLAGPASIAMAIDDNGAFVDSDASPDLTMSISVLEIPALLADPARLRNHLLASAHADGDAALAATITELAATLPWFVERLLARALGPIVGIRVADAGRRLLEMPDYVAQRFGASTASYLRDEVGLVVGADAVRNLGDEVSALAKRVDELIDRFARLDVSRKPRSRATKSP